jgi:hypothetical protein
MNQIEELRSVIKQLHGATAVHVKSVPVKETWKGQTVWDGIVEVFDITGHPKTGRIYAWSHETDDPKNPIQHVTVLHIPPAISPETAVRTALVQEYRNAHPAQA